VAAAVAGPGDGDVEQRWGCDGSRNAVAHVLPCDVVVVVGAPPQAATCAVVGNNTVEDVGAYHHRRLAATKKEAWVVVAVAVDLLVVAVGLEKEKQYH
jgi:hypothetical protein